jgi:hypothetical protein
MKNLNTYWAPNKSMIGTDPGIALNANSDAIAIIAARPFYIVNT